MRPHNKKMLDKADEEFPFSEEDVVLSKYANEIYYAKILSIDYSRRMVKLLFDDNSQDEVEFHNVFSVNETTADIICVVCKEDRTSQDDDIVLCDICSVGFHQKCHEPNISSDILSPEVPWQCFYCEKNKENPYIQSNPFQEKERKEFMMNLKDGDRSDDKENTCNSKIIEDTYDNTILKSNEYNEKNDDHQEIISPNAEKSKHGLGLNHTDSSPFEFVSNSKGRCTIPIKQSFEIDTKHKIKCCHHDMENNNFYNHQYENETKYGIIHCDHSDIYKKLSIKEHKISRAKPWMREKENCEDNLGVDVENYEGNYYNMDYLSTDTPKEKRKENRNEISNHSLLSERLNMGPKNSLLKKQILERNLAAYMKNSRSEKVKGIEWNNQSTDELYNLEEGNIKIVKVESLSKKSNLEHTLESNDNDTLNEPFTSATSVNGSSQSIVSTSSNSVLQDVLDTVHSFTHQRGVTTDKPPMELTTSVAISLQPKIITTCPSKQYSIPSSEDLKAIRYNSLSAFSPYNDETANPRSNKAVTLDSNLTNTLKSNSTPSSCQVSKVNNHALNNHIRDRRPPIEMDSMKSNDANLPFQINDFKMRDKSLPLQLESSKIRSTINDFRTQNYQKQNFANMNIAQRQFINQKFQLGQPVHPIVQMQAMQMASPLMQLNAVAAIQNVVNATNQNILVNAIQSGRVHQNAQLAQLAAINNKSQFSKLSPLEIQRRLQIQKQLLSQKQWIEEHENRKISKPNDINEQLQCKPPPELIHREGNYQMDKQEPSVAQDNEKVIEDRIDILAREIKQLQRQKERLSASTSNDNYQNRNIEHREASRNTGGLTNNHPFSIKSSKEYPVSKHNDTITNSDKLSSSNYSPINRTDQANKTPHNGFYQPKQRIPKSGTPPSSSYQKPDNNDWSRQKYQYHGDSDVYDNLLMNELQHKHDESENQKRINYELRRIKDLTERKSSRHDEESQKNDQAMLPNKSYRGTDNHRISKSRRSPPYPKSMSPTRTYYESPEASLKRKITEPVNSNDMKYRRKSLQLNQLNSLSVSSTSNVQYSSPGSQMQPASSISGYKQTNTSTSQRMYSLPENEGIESYTVNKEPSKKKKPCGWCGKQANFLCSECRFVWYCTQKCQLEDWKDHGSACRRLKNKGIEDSRSYHTLV